MNALSRSITQIFKGAVKAFKTFPATIASALAFTLVTIIRIHVDWPQQETYNFLFNSLHWAFALGVVFSLAAITAAQSRFNDAKSFLNANLLSLLAVAATFLLLYLLGGTDFAPETSRYVRVSGLAASRVGVAMLLSFLAFIVLAAYPKDQSDFARSFFMTQKAFFIALIYGSVIMAGSSGVAGAVEALLYPEMSEKVYQYIVTLAGFLSLTIFVGYFPDFRRGEIDERREEAQKQPRFIEILLGYIMIPIVLALTAVLLIWAGKTFFGGSGYTFIMLSSIASSYAVGGIWLHIMVTHHETGLAKFYRRAYPIAALVILAFEAWALIVQLNKYGMKMTEYSFMIIWVIAVAAAILMLILKSKAHITIVVITCALAVFSVLPGVGYHAWPVSAQTDRLERLLVSQGMLEGDQVIPAASEPELAVRQSITDAVVYLAYAEDAKLPSWFDKNFAETEVFKARFGFEQAWPALEDTVSPRGSMGISLFVQPGSIEISDYRWAVNLQDNYGKGNESVSIQGDKGVYKIYWTLTPPHGIPVLKIMLNDRVILEQDMNPYIDRISRAYQPDQPEPRSADIKDMSWQLETPEIAVLLVFNYVDINLDPQEDSIRYSISLDALYLRENP